MVYSKVYCPGHEVEGNGRADRLAGKQPSQMPCFSEDLKCRGAWDTTCRHKAKDITPSRERGTCLSSRKISNAEELETLPAGTKPRASHHRSPGGERRGKRKRYTIFLERTREGHCQSDERWSCFKGNVGENIWETGWSVCELFRAHRYHLELNWTV